VVLLDEVAKVLPPGVADRPWGEDVEQLLALLRSGWAQPEPARPDGAAEVGRAQAPENV
jgi:hypothetical protein